MHKVLALLAALALFLGACDSGGETSTSTDGSTDVTDEGSGGETKDDEDVDEKDKGGEGTEDDGDAASDPQDQARLDAALDEVDAALTGRGYSTSRSPADDDADDDDELEFESAQCQEADEVFNRLEEEYPETAASESLEANRGSFTGPDSEVEQLTLEFTSFSRAEDVERAFETLASVPLAECMREAFEAQSDEDFSVEIESVDVADGDRGDRELTITIAAKFSGDGMEIPVDVVFTFVGVDRNAIFFISLVFNSSTSADAFAALDLAVDALR